MVERPYSNQPFTLLRTVNSSTWATKLQEKDMDGYPSPRLGNTNIKIKKDTKVLFEYGTPYIHIPYKSFREVMSGVKYDIRSEQYK